MAYFYPLYLSILKINVHFHEPSMQEGDEDVLVGDTEPEPGIRSSSKINVHVPEQSVKESD